jgi:hypothetical protein
MDLKLLAHIAANGKKGLTLENMDDDLPDGGDSAIGSYAEACDDAFEASEQHGQALEAIRDYSEQLATLIRRKEVNVTSLALIRQGAQHAAKRMEREIVMPALESIEAVSLEAQATIALESFKNFLNNVVQEFVLGFKHHKDLIGDFLRTTSQVTAKYEKKTLENKRHWQDVKSTIAGGDVSVGANGLLYFFAKGKEDPTVGKLLGKGVLVPAIREDLAHSKYILTQYPKTVLQEMRSLSAILRTASFKKPEDMRRMAAQVEKLKTPVELFDSKRHGAELLGATQLVARQGKPKEMMATSEHKPMTRLAAMAGAKHMGHVDSNGMNFVRGNHAAGSVAGALALNAVVPGIGPVVYGVKHLATTLPVAAITSTAETAYTFNTKEIPVIFELAESYLDNVRACIGYEREIVRAMDELEAAIEKADESGDHLVDELTALEKKDHTAAEKGWHEFTAACHVFEHVVAYAHTLRRAIQKPVHGEIARALRASKYCNYLGLRAIQNAETKVAKEDYEEPSDALKGKYEQLKAQYDKLKEREEGAQGAELESIQASKSRLSRELRGKELWPLTMKDRHHLALEGEHDEGHDHHEGGEHEYKQLSDEFKKARDESHAAYKSGNDQQWADSHKRSAQARNKLQKANHWARFTSEHPEHFNGSYRPANEGIAVESLDEAKHHVGETVKCGVSQKDPITVHIVDLRLNGGKIEYLVKSTSQPMYGLAVESLWSEENKTELFAFHGLTQDCRSDDDARHHWGFKD